VLRRVVEPALAIQIETKKAKGLRLLGQQLTRDQTSNVGTLVGHSPFFGGQFAQGCPLEKGECPLF
jgi:hypothetical protein